jgi:hypothetical protein
MTFKTGRGTTNEIDWGVDPDTINLSPHTITNTYEAGMAIATVAPVPNMLDGTYLAGWWVDPVFGLSIDTVRFIEGTSTAIAHRVAERLQWRNLRLVFKGGSLPAAGVAVPVDLSGRCSRILQILSPGERVSDCKLFACATIATSLVRGVVDPRGGVKYDVSVGHAFFFAAPQNDLEPSGHVQVLKVYPMLSVKLIAHGTPVSSPDIAADLKMVFAPQVNRDKDPDQDGQRRPASQYADTSDKAWKKAIPLPLPPTAGDVVVYSVCDTNDETRNLVGAGYPIPNPPDWDNLFDYIVPGATTEMAFDAVVYPRGPRSPNLAGRPSFAIPWSPSDYSVTLPDSTTVAGLKCVREPGQGEYDNIHVSPYLGFDDPASGNPSSGAYPLIEAPGAADEVIHMHWRWGRPAVAGADQVRVSSLPFKGWGDETDPRPNQLEGAPLIPPNQSLRIKLGKFPSDDTSDPPDGSTAAPSAITKDAVTVWYMPTAHAPKIGTLTQFCGHGYALAVRLIDYTNVIFVPVPLSPGTFIPRVDYLTNADFLGNPLNPLKPSYHRNRWTYFGHQQRVPNGDPKLSRNKLNIPGAPQLDSVIPAKPP